LEKRKSPEHDSPPYYSSCKKSLETNDLSKKQKEVGKIAKKTSYFLLKKCGTMDTDFPKYFADAESTFDEAHFIIYGVPYDKTSTFRKGAKDAPKTIRQASWNFETYNIKTDVDLKDIKIHDYGDLDVKNNIPETMIKKTWMFTSKLLDKKKFPIALGGEHSITSGIIKAFPRDIAVLSLDAHIDFRQQYGDEKYNHACAIRRIAEHTGTQNIAVLGIRSADKDELKDAKKSNLLYVDAYTIRKMGIHHAIETIDKHFEKKQIYLTLDIDVIDPAYAPGTSTPEPFGITPFDVLDCIDFFSSKIIGFDVVEVCPSYDHGETSILAAKLIRHLIEVVWKKRYA